ncbi:MAG TPA: dephospho-CoA kinase [Terriglobia bacterium]|nr:dephospho-CoA kinase [Terriglobia bacterium]
MILTFPCFGLTGGIASGKSVAAAVFSALGAKVVDADLIAHDLLRPPSSAYSAVVREFGEETLTASGEIDRKALGRLVFADAEKRLLLNGILHPHILALQEEMVREAHDQDAHAVIVVEAALIYEAGVSERFSKIVVAWCHPDQQIERLMAKTGLPRDQAEARVAAQMPTDEKRQLADYVIDCSRDIEDARRQAAEVYAQLAQLAG